MQRTLETPAILEQYELMLAVGAPEEAWAAFEQELAAELGRVSARLASNESEREELRSYVTRLEQLRDAVTRRRALH